MPVPGRAAPCYPGASAGTERGPVARPHFRLLMDRLDELLPEYWPPLVFGVSMVAGTGAAVHAALTKHDVRAPLGWVGVAPLSPQFRAPFYFVAGFTRIPQSPIPPPTPHT